MVGHEAIGQHPHPETLMGFGKDLLKCGVAISIGEHRPAIHPTVKDVVNRIRRRDAKPPEHTNDKA